MSARFGEDPAVIPGVPSATEGDARSLLDDTEAQGGAISPACDESKLVTAQMGRQPRTPWRVAVRCGRGFPQVIASPSQLDNKIPFPTMLWLTCPALVRLAFQLESAEEMQRFRERAQTNSDFADALRYTDTLLRQARATESGGHDICATVGIAGGRDPLSVKCLHAHVALALAGLKDPIGEEILAKPQIAQALLGCEICESLVVSGPCE